MYYDGWEDTVQINYGNPEARQEMCNILKKIAQYAGRSSIISSPAESCHAGGCSAFLREDPGQVPGWATVAWSMLTSWLTESPNPKSHASSLQAPHSKP